MLFSIDLKITNLSSGSKCFYTRTDFFKIYNLTFLFPWLCDEGFDCSTIYTFRAYTPIEASSSLSSAPQPWVGLGLLKQMSPANSILGSGRPISTIGVYITNYLHFFTMFLSF